MLMALAFRYNFKFTLIMNIKITSLFFLFSSLVFCQVTSEYKNALNEMIQVSGTKDALLASVNQMKTMLKSQFPNVEKAQWEEVEIYITEVSLPDLLNELAPVYYAHLSLEDLQSLIAFYHTEAGMKFAQKTPLIAEESMLLGQQWGLDLAQKLQQLLQ